MVSPKARRDQGRPGAHTMARYDTRGGEAEEAEERRERARTQLRFSGGPGPVFGRTRKRRGEEWGGNPDPLNCALRKRDFDFARGRAVFYSLRAPRTGLLCRRNRPRPLARPPPLPSPRLAPRKSPRVLTRHETITSRRYARFRVRLLKNSAPEIFPPGEPQSRRNMTTLTLYTQCPSDFERSRYFVGLSL